MSRVDLTIDEAPAMIADAIHAWDEAGACAGVRVGDDSGRRAVAGGGWDASVETLTGAGSGREWHSRAGWWRACGGVGFS